MRRLCLVLLVIAIVPAFALAQEAKREHKGQGYVFVAPGGTAGCGGSTVALLHFGGGGEALLYKGLGVGAELGFLAPMQYLGDGIGILSVNGSYHFLNASATRKMIPFVTGGYSLAFRSGAANGVNLGGGINYWLGERLGLRVEFRTHSTAGNFSCQMWQARFGLAFR